MADTREHIMEMAEELIRTRGYNAFSYVDISKPLAIRNAAIHYYFPKKSDLAIAIIRNADEKHEAAWQKNAGRSALHKLKVFMDVYANSHNKGLVCMVGAMAAEFNSFDPIMQEALKTMVDHIADKVSGILAEGLKNGEFSFKEKPRTKALLIITNMLASLQLERITGKNEFKTIKEAVLKSLNEG